MFTSDITPNQSWIESDPDLHATILVAPNTGSGAYTGSLTFFVHWNVSIRESSNRFRSPDVIYAVHSVNMDSTLKQTSGGAWWTFCTHRTIFLPDYVQQVGQKSKSCSKRLGTFNFYLANKRKPHVIVEGTIDWLHYSKQPHMLLTSCRHPIRG